MMKCPSCNHDNVDGTTFCEMCGEELSVAAPASNGSGSTPAGGDAAAASGDIKCPACENLNPRENVVCEVCGTELQSGGAAVVTSMPAMPPAADTTTAAMPAPSTLPSAATDSTAASSDAMTSAPSTPAAPDASAASAPADLTTTQTNAPVAIDNVTAPVVAPVADAAPSTDAASTPSAPAVPLKPGMIKLVVEQGMNVGKQFVLGDAEMQVGREDEEEDIYPDIDLADQDEGYVHRKHATLKFENDQLFVTHLGGANKTRLNNKPVPDNAPQAVKLGDKLAFGKVVTRVIPHS